MAFRISPLAIAVSSTLLLPPPLLAEDGGGSAGANGSPFATANNTSQGAAGTFNAKANGGKGQDIASTTITLNARAEPAPPLVMNGTPGQNGEDRDAASQEEFEELGGAGAGGHGGGSVTGAISQGGAGGADYSLWQSQANGGSGGEINGNALHLTDVVLQGGKGGNGGQAIDTGAGGHGGHGGGSVFGGISSGAAAGLAEGSSRADSPPDASTNGGQGGQVFRNTITLESSALHGAAGGQGGDSLHTENGRNEASAGGNGGHGGGSVFGGISSGGAAGFAQSNAISFSNGGHGGEVSGHAITLRDVSLAGNVGGNGGNSLNASDLANAAAAGNAGHGGGSVFGGISSGGAGGYALARAESAPLSDNRANGGQGGAVSGNSITLIRSTLSGAAGGDGGMSLHQRGPSDSHSGGAGHGGHGGGSIFGGLNSGAAGGYARADFSAVASSTGGSGAQVSNNSITLTQSNLTGAAGGNGGDSTNHQGYASAGGNAGHGGGSVFGGLSSGAAGGAADAQSSSNNTASAVANGGAGGQLSNNTITLNASSLKGAAGGNGGNSIASEGNASGGGEGGHGGGSVFGGLSSGAAGGSSYAYSFLTSTAMANGGVGGEISGNRIALHDTVLTGSAGGRGGQASGAAQLGGAGHSGQAGGSVFGGISSGAAGGSAYALSEAYEEEGDPHVFASANGGDGGNVRGNAILIMDSTLNGVDAGLQGGSVVGGLSSGGAGGYAKYASDYGNNTASANGGNGGAASNNSIIIGGQSTISGSVYGGISQGGQAGTTEMNARIEHGQVGSGGRAENNTITLMGENLKIEGGLYGGYSVNGDGTLNHNSGERSQHLAFSGNTLNLHGYRGAVAGVYNFENYYWLLPKNVVNHETVIHITGNDKVQLDHTQHKVAMFNDGKRLNTGDLVTLIDKAQGTPALTTPTIQQGHFITYDTQMNVINDALVLRIDGKEDTTPPTPEPIPEPAGRVTPTAKAFLEGRLASMAQINQGADAISGIGLDAARSSVGRCGANLFMFIDGGSNRYETGSHIKLRNTNFGFGAANCFALASQSQVLVGAFVEHGNGNYDSYNQFEQYDDVHGWGKVRYTGAGVLMHMNVAGTGSAAKDSAPSSSSIARNDGLYLDAAIRAGKAKTRFDSNLVDPEGLKGEYNAKSTYYSVMAGAGYALNLDEKQAVDLYSRFTWSHLGSDTVTVGKDTLHLDNLNSSRLRLGARYSYAATAQVTPYVGLAYEREFSGKSKGSAYGMAIDSPTLKGNTGIAELGLTVVPNAAKQALSVNFGVQGYFSDRKGGAASLRVRYAF